MVCPLRSRSGCLRCRQRHKKCGEEKPVCDNCRRLGVVCQWSTVKKDKDISALQQVLSQLYCSLVVHTKYGSAVRMQPTSLGICPAAAVSHGHELFKSETESALFRGFIKFREVFEMQSVSYTRNSTLPTPYHEITLTLAHSWLREPLLSLAAVFVKAPGLLSPEEPYRRYAIAVKSVRARLSISVTRQEKEQLLVAVFLMAVQEAFYSESAILPCPYFQIAGRLLCDLMELNPGTAGPSDQDVFHRIVFETYLGYSSTSAYFCPRGFSSTTLFIRQDSERVPSNARLNIVCSYDVNAQILLFELSHYVGSSGVSVQDASTMQQLSQRINNLHSFYAESTNMEISDGRDSLFSVTTLLVGSALKIYCAKVQKTSISSGDSHIRAIFEYAQNLLRNTRMLIQLDNNLVWAFAILVCAARTTDELTHICQRFNHDYMCLKGDRLQHVMALLAVLKSRIGAGRSDRESDLPAVMVEGLDNLDLILQPP